MLYMPFEQLPFFHLYHGKAIPREMILVVLPDVPETIGWREPGTFPISPHSFQTYIT
jgi:hypothetical protein